MLECKNSQPLFLKIGSIQKIKSYVEKTGVYIFHRGLYFTREIMKFLPPTWFNEASPARVTRILEKW